MAFGDKVLRTSDPNIRHVRGLCGRSLGGAVYSSVPCQLGEHFLHPVPREYKATVPQAFSKVRDLLFELLITIYDRRHVVTAEGKVKESQPTCGLLMKRRG